MSLRIEEDSTWKSNDMRRKMIPCLALFILVAVATAGHGQTTVYNDGNTHTVAGSSGPIIVLDNSTLIINSPAYVTNASSPTAAAVLGAYSTIELDGGQVINSFSEGTAIDVDQGTFTASGGMVQSGGNALIASGSIQISGGAFISGEGAAAALYITPGGSESISGGTFQGNAGNIPGTGLSLVLEGSTQGSITGGNFIGAGVSGESLYYLGYSNTSLNISGGTYTGLMNFFLEDYSSSLNFFGQGFQLQQIIPNYEYSLTGTLADGNALAVTLITRDFTTQIETVGGQEELTFAGLGSPPPVPEPPSIVAFGTGFVGLAIARAVRLRRRRKTAA
jgi:hypothetical protein